MITIVGMGPGPKKYWNIAALDAVKKADQVFVQSARHPAVALLKEEGIPYSSMDEAYEEASDFDDLCRIIASELLQNAREQDIVYAAIGQGRQGNASFSVIQDAARRMDIPFSFVPGMDYASCACAEAGVESEACSIAFQALEENRIDPSRALCICEVDCQITASELKLVLERRYAPEQIVSVVTFDALGAEVTTIPLYELDRQEEYSHTTCVVLPRTSMEQRPYYDMADLMDIMAQLRGDGGCPWDREQTHQSLKPHMIEECYEAVGAIEEGDPDDLAEELGDVLLQIALHAQIAKEMGKFDYLDVASGICRKMIRRHPHVFSNVAVQNADEVLDNWDAIKRKEKGVQAEESLLKNVGRGLPSMMRAQKLQKKAARVGFDFPNAREASQKVLEELEEALEEQKAEDRLGMAREAGDLLFACVNVVRLLGVDAEEALYQACEKFCRRFFEMENLAKNSGSDLSTMTLAELDALWNQAKAGETDASKNT